MTNIIETWGQPTWRDNTISCHHNTNVLLLSTYALQSSDRFPVISAVKPLTLLHTEHHH